MSKLYLDFQDEINIREDENYSDEELVMKSIDNPRLFEIFVERYQAVFLRTARNILRAREESEDVVQEAFVKIYFNVKKYQRKPGIKFKSWAFKILINCVFTRYRKLKRTMGNVEYLDQVLYLNEGSHSDFSFDKKLQRDEIESVLKKMPEELSGLMRDHYLSDRPYLEIAEDRDISVPALKMKLYRARKKFKEVLDELK